MLTLKCIVFPISFCLEKQTYNDVLIAIYYYASYCFTFYGLWLLTRTKSNPTDKTYWEKRPDQVLLQIVWTVFLFSNWGCHKDHFSNDRALALQPDRHAITYCCGSTCWKVRVWVRKEYHGKTHCFSYPLTASFASLHGTGCAMCLFAIIGCRCILGTWQQWPQPLSQGQHVTYRHQCDFNSCSISCGYTSEPRCTSYHPPLLLFWLLPRPSSVL